VRNSPNLCYILENLKVWKNTIKKSPLIETASKEKPLLKKKRKKVSSVTRKKGKGYK